VRVHRCGGGQLVQPRRTGTDDPGAAGGGRRALSHHQARHFGRGVKALACIPPVDGPVLSTLGTPRRRHKAIGGRIFFAPQLQPGSLKSGREEVFLRLPSRRTVFVCAGQGGQAGPPHCGALQHHRH